MKIKVGLRRFTSETAEISKEKVKKKCSGPPAIESD